MRKLLVICAFLLVSSSIGYLQSPQITNSNEKYEHSRRQAKWNNNGLNITNPLGGEIISGLITVSWTLQDILVVDSTHFQVDYSPNGGTNWIIISETHEYSLEWNTSLYREYAENCRIKVSASSKEYNTIVEITDIFTIDNRKITNNVGSNNDLLTYIAILASLTIVGIGVLRFRPYLFKQKTFLDVIQSEQLDWLKSLSHKVVIGLDNIKTGFVDEIKDLPELTPQSLSTTIVDIFPPSMKHDLLYHVKGRTVLTLIEIAFQNPADTAPSKISKSLNIPLSTLSKEIKKLVELSYVETSITNQMIQDARFKSFTITEKGYSFLINLDKALKIAIERVKN